MILGRNVCEIATVLQVDRFVECIYGSMCACVCVVEVRQLKQGVVGSISRNSARLGFMNLNRRS